MPLAPFMGGYISNRSLLLCPFAPSLLMISALVPFPLISYLHPMHCKVKVYMPTSNVLLYYCAMAMILRQKRKPSLKVWEAWQAEQHIVEVCQHRCESEHVQQCEAERKDIMPKRLKKEYSKKQNQRKGNVSYRQTTLHDWFTKDRSNSIYTYVEF